MMESANQLSNEERKFYEDLFSLYDTENRGYIDIDRFIEVTKEKMPADNWKNDQQLSEFVKILDPFNFGQIDFGQFVIGIKKLTNDDMNNNNMPSEKDNNRKEVVTNLIDSSLSLLDADFEGKSNSSQISSNETFYEYDSDQLKSVVNSPNSSHNAEASPTSASATTTTAAKSNDEKTPFSSSTSHFDQRIFEIGSGSAQSSGGESENDADKNSSSTFDMATFDRKELNDFDLHTGSGELIILDEFGNSKATSRQTSTTSTATTNATGVANQLSRTKSGEKYKSNEQGKQQQEAAAESSSLEDPFGLDIEVINNHRKSLSINSFSSLSDLKTHQTPPLTKRNSLISTKRRVSELYQNSSGHSSSGSSNGGGAGKNDRQHGDEFNIIDSGDYLGDQSLYKSMHLDTREHDQLIEEYEMRIKDLSIQNDNLLIENKEYLNRMTKLNNDNMNLIEKIRELEESNIEFEKKFQVLLSEEKSHYQDQLNKINAKLNEEKDNYLIQISMLENQIKQCKEESFKYLKDLNEVSKKVEESEDRLNEETEKYEKLRLEFHRAVRERESIEKARELEHLQETATNEALSKELDDLRYKYQLMQKQRSNTLYLGGPGGAGSSGGLVDEAPTAAFVRELETEIRQLKAENTQLLNQFEEAKAHALKNDLDNGRMLLHMSASNAPSLAAEMDIMSKDELMEKLKGEQAMSQRMREYIDNMLSKIMEYTPEILEICTGGGGAEGKPSTAQTRSSRASISSSTSATTSSKAPKSSTSSSSKKSKF